MKLAAGKKMLFLVAVALILAVGLVLQLFAGAAAAKDRDELVAEKQATATEIEKLKSQISGLDVRVQETFLQLTETKNKIPAAEEELAKAEAQLSAAEREAQKNAALLTAAQAELAQITKDKNAATEAKKGIFKSLAELARATYRGDVAPSSLSLIVGASSATDFINAHRANSAITRSQTKALDAQAQASAVAANREARQDAVETVVRDLKDKSDALVSKQEKAKAAAQAKRAELSSLQSKYESFVTQLQGQKSLVEESIRKQEQAQAEISAEIARIDAENRRKAAELARQKQNRKGGGASSPGEGIVITSSDWIQTPLPKPLRITSPFAHRVNPVSGRREFHPAIDIGAACGTVQRSGADGVIAKFIHNSQGTPYGNAVYINHGIIDGASWVTFHAHLSRIDVQIGQHVKKGEPIGLTGTTGWSTGCHLHYEVHRNGKPINPMSLPSFQ